MIELPNPFNSTLASDTRVEAAAAPELADPPVAAAVNFDSRSVLDEAAFMEAIEQPPAFLSAPSLPYLAIVEVLAGH